MNQVKLTELKPGNIRYRLGKRALLRNSRYRSLPLFHPLTLLLLAFTCNTFLWAAVTNIGNPPDEFSHFDYIRHLATTHALPVYGETRYIDSQALQAHASLPPLYYLIGAPLQMALSNATVTQQVLALRGLSLLLGAITVALAYRLGRMLAPARPAFALAVAVVVGFNPMFTYMSASINSDSLINLIYAALFLLLASGLKRQQPGRRWLIGLGALLGAGLITKQTILMGVLVSALVILFLAWRQRPRFFRTLVSYSLWVGTTATLISAWYFARNWMLYGNPTGILASGRPDIYPTHPYSAVGSIWEMIFTTKSDSLPFFPMVLQSFWGIFDHLEILMPPRIYVVMTCLLAGGLLGAALWMVRSWRHRNESLTRRRLLLAVMGALMLTFAFAALVSLCYRIDIQPQGRYLFAALAPLAAAIVGGWEQLGGLLRARWLIAPVIVVLVLTVNVMGLLFALAPTHHGRYLGRLLLEKQVETGEGESYARDNRYVPKLPLWPKPALSAVYGGSPVQATFVAQQTGIERLEMLLSVPPGVHGPLIWRLSQQGSTDNLLETVVRQPLAGPAYYGINVIACRFMVGQVYVLKLEAPATTAQQPFLAGVEDEGAFGSLGATDLTLQVIYPGVFNKQALLRAEYFLRSDTPNSPRGSIQRLLYPLDSLFFLALAVVALAPLLTNPRRMAIAAPVLGMLLFVLLSPARTNATFVATYETTPMSDLPPERDSISAPVYEGFHDSADCNVIGGWAWNANEPNSPIDVAIYDGTALVTTISANVFRADLLQARIGNGYHGFIYAVDGLLKNGQPHSIRAKFAGANIDLWNTPRSITCSTVAAPTNVASPDRPATNIRKSG